MRAGEQARVDVSRGQVVGRGVVRLQHAIGVGAVGDNLHALKQTAYPDVTAVGGSTGARGDGNPPAALAPATEHA